jgi:hypothetical protein
MFSYFHFSCGLTAIANLVSIAIFLSYVYGMAYTASQKKQSFEVKSKSNSVRCY